MHPQSMVLHFCIVDVYAPICFDSQFFLYLDKYLLDAKICMYYPCNAFFYNLHINQVYYSYFPKICLPDNFKLVELSTALIRSSKC